VMLKHAPDRYRPGMTQFIIEYLQFRPEAERRVNETIN
jgi:hypothetical protein